MQKLKYNNNADIVQSKIRSGKKFNLRDLKSQEQELI